MARVKLDGVTEAKCRAPKELLILFTAQSLCNAKVQPCPHVYVHFSLRSKKLISSLKSKCLFVFK